MRFCLRVLHLRTLLVILCLAASSTDTNGESTVPLSGRDWKSFPSPS